jgi:transcriptional regulator with GAF, ATPase, and Fis domain
VAIPQSTQTGVMQSGSVDEATDREQVLRALVESAGKVGGTRGAAARLGLPRTTLQARMKKLNIKREYC